jgi:hypothetical protein
MRGLVRELGADPAATDPSHVMPLPGLYNHKYSSPFMVRAQSGPQEIYRPEQFPNIGAPTAPHPSRPVRERAAIRLIGITQSERDWAYAKRALGGGDDPDAVANAIERCRQHLDQIVHRFVRRPKLLKFSSPLL